MAARFKLGAQVVAVALVGGMLVLLIWKVVNQGGGAAAQLRHGKSPHAPNFTLPRLDREGKLDLVALRGKAVVLNFWASWCIPCKKEAPRLEAAWRKWRNRGVVVLGVDVNDFAGDARSFARKYRLTYPIVRDGSGTRVIEPYGLTGFPETFFVGRSGKLVGEHVEGPVSKKELKRNIRLALRS